jgi:hypothetical protein
MAEQPRALTSRRDRRGGNTTVRAARTISFADRVRSWLTGPRRHVVAGGLLCGLVLLAYSNSFHGGFVLDNRVLILEDVRVHQLSVDNLSNIISHSYWWPVVESGLYRPVTTLSYLVNYAILGHGDSPIGYHVVNLLLHMVNVLLVLALALRLSRNLLLSGVIAAVWAVHPLGTEAVTNIIGRADLLAAMGSLAALYGHLRARESGAGSRRWLWMLAVAVAMTIGVFSKENAVAVVAVAMLFDIVFLERRISSTALISGWIPFAVPLALLWYQRGVVLGETAAAPIPFVDNPIAGAGFWQGRLTALAVIGRYLWLIVWPARLSPDYSFPQIPLVSGTAQDWLAWMAVAAAAVVTILLWQVKRPVALVVVSALLLFLPVSNLAFPTGTIMAERLVYLPMVGVIAAMVVGLFGAAERLRVPAAAPIAAAAIVAVLGVRTWVRNPDWRSEVSLWTSAVSAAPNSFKTHGALAEALYNADPTRGNLPQVIAEKEKSLALLEGVPDPAAVSLPHREAATYYLEFGDWLVEQGHAAASPEVGGAYRQATQAANRFLALANELQGGASARDITAAQLIVSSAFQRLNDSEGAVAAGRNAVRLEPFNPKAYQVAAAAFVSGGQRDNAAEALMAGFIVTGDKELRSLLIQLYRGGLDTGNCAVSSTPKGDVLNSSCEVVARHLCAAARHAMDVQRQNGRPDLADRIQATSLQGLDCPAESSIRMSR